MMNDKDTNASGVPSDASDHDERDETLATDIEWSKGSNDAAAVAGKRLAEFKADDVPLSDEDWEKEEKQDDEIPDHLDAAVDASLDAMIDAELSRDDAESDN
jgi:hypothetical protein